MEKKRGEIKLGVKVMKGVIPIERMKCYKRK
jgi:hypothetical protein